MADKAFFESHLPESTSSGYTLHDLMSPLHMSLPVRKLSSPTPFNLNLTSLFYLNFVFFVYLFFPLLNLNFSSASSGISNCSLETTICGTIMEKNTIKKTHIKEFGGGMPRKRPRDKFGTSQGHRDAWADVCGHSKSRGRMSTGQTGHVTGQMGHVHGTDGTHTKGCPPKILYVYWFFLCPTIGILSYQKGNGNRSHICQNPTEAQRKNIPFGTF